MQKEYVKSLLNFQGGKYKILNQILPLFPKKIDTFVDIFAGGLNVSMNVKSKQIIANDLSTPLIDLFKNIRVRSDSFESVMHVINYYKLDAENSKGYYELRKDYNDSQEKYWEMFYVLTCHSFNNQIRFNKKGGFNLPFGSRTFNIKQQRKFKKFSESLKLKNIGFINEDFRDFGVKDLNKNDLVYLDPPYLLGMATYNENGGWTLKEELKMLKYLDELNKQGIKFALSNVTHHKGKENEYLIEFAKKYTIHEINSEYSNCNHQAKKSNTREVLVVNYES